MIEAVTGQRHQDVVRERVLQPLGLRSTVWSAGDLPPEQIATGYRKAGDGFEAEVPLSDGGYFSALGGLYSSVRDLARWSGVFLGAEPPRDAPEEAPVSRATLREMARPAARSRRASNGRRWLPAGRGRRGLRLRPHDLARARRAAARRAPWGLPGFGTLMRWVPELGLSVILLANLTYAKCEWPVRQALELIAREAALPRRIIRADPGLLAARDAIDGLVERWDDDVAARLFSPNVDLDRPLSERREELASLRDHHGALTRDGDFEPEDALRGSWWLRERGHVELNIRWPRPFLPRRGSRSSPSCHRPAGSASSQSGRFSSRVTPMPRLWRACSHPAPTQPRPCAGYESPPRCSARSASPR